MIEQSASGLLEEILLRDKPAKILLSLKTSKDSIYATILSRETNCTYSHTIKILDMFKEQGLVEFEKVGRIKKVKLTPDGWDVAQILENLTKKLDNVTEKLKKAGQKKLKKKK